MENTANSTDVVMNGGRWHELKILPQFFNSVAAGTKLAELRKNDRNYQVGDVLVLNEWTTEYGYSGRKLRRIISDVCDVGFIVEGYVMLSLSAVETVFFANGGKSAFIQSGQ